MWCVVTVKYVPHFISVLLDSGLFRSLIVLSIGNASDSRFKIQNSASRVRPVALMNRLNQIVFAILTRFKCFTIRFHILKLDDT